MGERLWAESKRLNDAYATQAEAWVSRMVSEHDVIIHNGGDVVMANLSHQCNRRVSDAIASAVRRGNILYMSRSAGTMVAAKTVEMSFEVEPIWLTHFSHPAALRESPHYSGLDLDEEGVKTKVLGGMPVIKSSIAMRPHFDMKSYASDVHAKMLAA